MIAQATIGEASPQTLTKHVYDTAEFMELLVAHLARSSHVSKSAKSLKINSDDLLTTTRFGNSLYKVFVDIILEVDDAPIGVELFGLKLKEKIKSGFISEPVIEEAASLWSRIYGIELNERYIAESLKEYIKYRREQKAKLELLDDTDALRAQLNKVAVTFDMFELEETAVTHRPFVNLMKKKHVNFIPTGFSSIDSQMGGLGRGEFGIIAGFSGGGKTALGCSIALNAVRSGKTVLYLSLEEPGENIVNRFYANVFNIPYTSLHRGESLELEQKFHALDADEKKIFKNLYLEDLRDVAPLTCNSIQERLIAKCKDEKIMPDVVIVDQMDYIEPNNVTKNTQEWEKYKMAAFELDALSHHAVDGKHHFALWVLHQVNGKKRQQFTNADLAGYKGVIKPADVVIGIGKGDTLNDEFNIFSIKTRHSKPFELTFYGELEFMRFKESTALYGESALTNNNQPVDVGVFNIPLATTAA